MASGRKAQARLAHSKEGVDADKPRRLPALEEITVPSGAGTLTCWRSRARNLTPSGTVIDLLDRLY
jgi:hypothetical protein